MMRPWLLVICAVVQGEAPVETVRIDIGGPWDGVFVLGGWYDAEGPYTQFGPIWRSVCRWGGQGAQLRLPVTPRRDVAVRLRAEIAAAPDQRLRIRVDDREVAAMEHRDDLLYSFTLPADVIGERSWLTIRFFADVGGPSDVDPRDLRAAVDWVEVDLHESSRDVIAEALNEFARVSSRLIVDRAPRQWRMRYDPNRIGDTHAPHRFDEIHYDDSAFDRVATGYLPPLRRGDAVWYRAWLYLDRRVDAVRRALRLPGEGFERRGMRRVWVNGQAVQPHQGETLRDAATRALNRGFNLIVVQLLEGLPAIATGDDFIAPPRLVAHWDADGVTLELERIVLREEAGDAQRLRVTLLDPTGATIARADAPVAAWPDGGAGVATEWRVPLRAFGQHTLVVADDRGRRRSVPVQHLGIHFFHWGWYSAISGTTWSGFKPTSNDYLDQLFDRIGEWPRPHHSISWGGAIFAPRTGFHATQGVDYVARFRAAFADGSLELVGMPYPPRNICTDFGESALRSMRRSRRIYEQQLGQSPTRFYSHDATLTPQLPQLMRLTGYDTYCIAENWWGQGRSLPNSRDGYWRADDGSRVRVLDSWYHGIPARAAVRRALEQGKPAVLCNEEFACLDSTVFLEREEAQALAAEGVFLTPVTLTEYQRITEAFAREAEYSGDDDLCYKGWTGGGEGEVEYEKVARLLETRLVALENLMALAAWHGLPIDATGVDACWDRSLRFHECHFHWGNGYPDMQGQMETALAYVDGELARLTHALGNAMAAPDGFTRVVVANPLAWSRRGLVRVPAAASARALIDPAGGAHPLQRDGDGQAWASLPELPSCGYRAYLPVETLPETPVVQARLSGGTVELDNGLITVIVAADGRIESVRDARTGRVLCAEMHSIYLARPGSEEIAEPLSAEGNVLNLAYYTRPVAAAPPEIEQGPVFARATCRLKVAAYPALAMRAAITLAAGERQARIALELAFEQPTAIAPRGGPVPHEGTYIPGIFAGFAYPAGRQPVVDMAYCLTDGALRSTNHATFLRVPFRHATFNALSLAGPAKGEYAVLTRGLPDFFVVNEPTAYLGLSLGTGGEQCPYHGSYRHEYALYLPERQDGGFSALLAAQSLLVEPVAVAAVAGAGTLPLEQSLISVEGKNVYIPGVQLEDGVFRARVVQTGRVPTRAALRSLIPLAGASVLPDGAQRAGVLQLPPRAVREVVVTTASTP